MTAALILGAMLALTSVAGGRPPHPSPSPRMYVTDTVTHLEPAIPYSGPISSVDVNAGDRRDIVVASESGGLFRSRDGGAGWTHQLAPQRTEDVAFLRVGSTVLGPGRCLCVIATANQQFESGRGGGGVWIAPRPEVSPYWNRATGIFPAESSRCPGQPSAHGIAIAPDTHKIYVATDCGLAVGDPSTLTFSTLDVSTPDPRLTAVAALGGGHLIVGGQSGFYHSSDDGAHWTRDTTNISGPLVDGGDARYGTHGLAADPRGGDRAYAVDWATNLYETTDGGATWTAVPSTPKARRAGCGGIGDVDAVQVGGNIDLYYGNRCDTKRAVFATTREATSLTTSSWTSINAHHGDTRDIATDPGDGSPYLVTSDGGISRRANGLDFPLIGGPRHGLDALQVTEVAHQYGGRDGDTMYFATQHTSNWAVAPREDPKEQQWEGAYLGLARYAPSRGDNRITQMACAGCGNFISNAAFADITGWPDAEPYIDHPDPQEDEPQVGVPAFLSQKHYVQYTDANRPGYRKGFEITTDEGQHWTQLFQSSYDQYGLPQVAGPTSDPTLTEAYFTGVTTSTTGQQVKLLQVRSFSGSARLPVTPTYAAMHDFGGLGVTPTEFAWYDVFAVDPRDPSRIIAPDVDDTQVKQSTDGGDHWTPIAGLAGQLTGGGYQFDVPDGDASRFFPLASVVSFCPDNDSRILIGTQQHGTWLSFDGGRAWTHLDDTDQIPDQTKVDWMPGCGGAYLSSYGRGIWSVEFTIHTTSTPCAPPVCALVKAVQQVARAKRGVPPRPGGAIVSDGVILSARRHGRTAELKVTDGSVVTPLAGTRTRVRSVAFRPSVLRGRDGAAFLFTKRGGVLIRTADPLRLAPLTHHKPGKGARPPALRAQLDIRSDLPGNGSFARVQPGEPVTVHGTVLRPLAAPLELDLDGVKVASYDASTKTFDFTTSGPLGLDVHSFTLKAAGKEAGSVAFIVPPHMDGADEGDAQPTPTPTPTPTATPEPTSLTLSCPATVVAKTTIKVSGNLTPGFAGAPIAVKFTEPNGTVTDNVATDPAGAYSDSREATSSGTWTIDAAFAGDASHGPSTAPTCTTQVTVQRWSSVSPVSP